MNKRGEEKVLSIWWFFVIIVTVGVISFAVVSYNSTSINVKTYQAVLLSEALANCLTNDGYLVEEIENENFDIFEFCRLNKKVLDSDSFNFVISFSDSFGEEIYKDIVSGRTSLKDDCEVAQVASGKHFPGCSFVSSLVFYFKDGEKKVLTLNISTVSQAEGKKISTING